MFPINIGIDIENHPSSSPSLQSLLSIILLSSSVESSLSISLPMEITTQNKSDDNNYSYSTNSK